MLVSIFNNYRTYEILKQDIIKPVYFICRLTQNQNGKGMTGVLSSKQDYMGGIFDRWINIIPESIVFNKGILPEISHGKNVEVISDFYNYDPSSDKAGIAPDVIGIRVNGNVIPFVEYDEKWKKIASMPQIELKTFKKSDYMVSLRNQRYDDKYLVMVQSNFRVDYLIPLIEKSILSNDIYQQMKMDDSKFIKSNVKGYLSELLPVDISDENIGTISLISITRADAFMSRSTCCESGVSVEWLKSIEPIEEPMKNVIDMKLSSLCKQRFNKVFSFSDDWYSGVDELGIPYRTTKKKNGMVEKTKVRTLDFYVENIDTIKVLKCNKLMLTIKALDDNVFNGVKLNKGQCYNLYYSWLPRGGSGEEYFMQKDIVALIDSYEEELKDRLEEIILNN